MEFFDQWLWYLIFIPLAALSGWVIGRRGGERHSDHQVSKLSTTYFRGLNYLLNEQPDKAIELFLHIAELDKDTFETQVALGHLFRRRGEVDRAIRLHQALVQRSDLSDPQKVQALLALGEDYMKSGLLDRAETVFTDLTQIDQRAPQALRHLISIYQAERDWEKAIENASRFEATSGEPMGKLIAQFECELSDRQRSAGDLDSARAAIVRAYAADSTSVRAGISEGRIATDAGNHTAAIRAFERAARHDPDFLPVILPALLANYDAVGERSGARAFLAEMCEHYRGISPVLALAKMVEAEDGVSEARQYLAQQLKDRPSVRGEAALIDLSLADDVDANATLQDLKHITD
ncbi:MAG: lipopolysaccharide assembly protein LapB, partial [Thermomonas sp.]